MRAHFEVLTAGRLECTKEPVASAKPADLRQDDSQAPCFHLRHGDRRIRPSNGNGEGDITVPVPVFLIEHPKRRALFDTGLYPDCQHDPAGRLGERSRGCSASAFSPAKKSARDSKRSTEIPPRSISLLTRILIPTTWAETC